MPYNCLGLLVGDTDADNAVGPPVPPGPPANALLTENNEPMLTEAGDNIVYE
jgi:hypothetical protein|tara:strand:- start:155 stop:310 length:156 start_codon:yes stop_codon:yes gene_type:complete